MAPVRNSCVLFNDIPPPNAYPDPGKTTVYSDSETIDLEAAPLNGGFLVKTIALSIDPYLRGRMRDPGTKDHFPPFIVGSPIANFAVGLVLRSEHPATKAGDHIYAFLPFQEYVVVKDIAQIRADVFRVLEPLDDLPWSAYVGICGMAGATAHHGWLEFADPKPGETAFTTSASGGVGGTVVQIAKEAGLKVIASVGSEEKAAYVRSLGADVVFNYKTEDTSAVLEREGGIDIFWDNVGGKTLEAALGAAHRHARFIECGMMSIYTSEPYCPKNLSQIIYQQLKVYGFVVGSLYHKYRERFYQEMPAKVASGKLKYLEDRSYGLESVGEAILAVQNGTNYGKKVVIVAQDT